MIEAIGRRLGLEPGEGRRAIALAVALAAITCSYTLTKTVRDASFLATHPATLLPYVYLGVGALTTLAAAAYARVTRRRSVWESLAILALVAAVSLAAFAQLFALRADWVPVAFYLWVNVYGLVLVAQFWVFANGVSHAREAKRTFSLVGLGGIVGGLIGGLLAAPLAHLWTLSSLLNVAAVVQAAMVPLVLAPGLRADLRAAAEAPEETRTEGNVLGHRYLRWLGLITLCSVMVAAVLDYLFKIEIQKRYPSAPELASFLGWFYTATNLAAITLQVFATRWMIQRLGAGWSASLLPIGVGIGAGAMLATPGAFTVIGTRLWEQVTRLSVNKAATELFYFPVEAGLRRKAKALIDSGLERVGEGLAGILILAVTLTLGTSSRPLAFVMLGLIAVWIAGWFAVRSRYVQELGRNLRRVNLAPQHQTISLREASVLLEMTRMLESPHGGVVLQAMEMLEENAPERLNVALPKLLAHASPRVRARALQLVGSRHLETERPRIEELMHDEDAEVRMRAMSALCAIIGGDPFEPMEEFLGKGDPVLRKDAILCLADHATPEQDVRLLALFQRLLAEGRPEDKLAVAEALGVRKAPSIVHDLLGPLLRDEDLKVRQAALRSAGGAERRTQVPVLIEALGARETEAAARAGLTKLGDKVVGTLGDYLGDAGVPIEIRLAVPRVLGDIHSQESANALFRANPTDDYRLEYRVLKAANKIRSSGRQIAFPEERIGDDLKRDVESYFLAFVHYRSCPIGEGRSGERLLCIVLNERMEQAVNRVFRRLALIYPPQNLLAAYQGLQSVEPRMRGDALEYLENALSTEHASLIMPLVDDSGDEARLQVGEERFGLRHSSYEKALEDIVLRGDPWLRACALYVIGSRRERSMLPLVESNLSTLDRFVRETAAWAQVALTAS